jgi:hypothetical protein
MTMGKEPSFPPYPWISTTVSWSPFQPLVLSQSATAKFTVFLMAGSALQQKEAMCLFHLASA